MPKDLIERTAYSEQLGWYRQRFGIAGEMNRW